MRARDRAPEDPDPSRSDRQASKFCAAVLVLLAPTLAACQVSAPGSATATIEFLTSSFDLGEIGWLSEQADESGVELNVNGLRAIDKDVAFLFGEVSVAAGTIRSVLLRTSDGGMTWHESMPPVLGSQLVHVAFSDPQHGWALAEWAVEQAGTMVLFASTDGGKTWRQLTKIHEGGFPMRMTFTSTRHGELELAQVSESTSADDAPEEIDAFATEDGGMTWKRVRRETRQWTPVDPSPVQHDRGFDSTDWELETGGFGDPIAVRRLDPERSHWRVTTLPTHFRYERGRVLTSP